MLNLYDVVGCAQEDARKMVLTMVEMERSYLTAEVFREILQQNGRSDHSGELIRTLSGRQVCSCLCVPAAGQTSPVKLNLDKVLQDSL